MTGLSARRLASAVAVSAVSALAVVLPATASATTIKGQGSTLQEDAQHKVFIPGFNEKSATEGGTVSEYLGTGSGAGLEAWGNNGHKAEFNVWQYVGTDQPPNPTQKAAIETAAGGAKVLSIPTVQAAVAIVMHLPKGCTGAKSNFAKAKGRLVLNNLTLEAIFRHAITKWNEIKDDGDELICAEPKDAEAPITRVVRIEGSGTTAIVKKYLFQINSGTVDGTKTWNDLAEQNKNLEWPEEGVNLLRGAGSGGIVSTVAGTYGSIGYVNLANAYGSTCFRGASCETEIIAEKTKVTLKGGENGEAFWAFVQSNGTGEKGKYENPEKIGKNVTIEKVKVRNEGASNCKGDIYVNGVGAKFPPKSTEEAWNEVSASPKNKKYALCGFTYDLSLVGFGKIPAEAQPTEAQVELLKKYFGYMVGEGGAKLGEGNDYFGLPASNNPEKSVAHIAQLGVEKISE